VKPLYWFGSVVVTVLMVLLSFAWLVSPFGILGLVAAYFLKEWWVKRLDAWVVGQDVRVHDYQRAVYRIRRLPRSELARRTGLD
jgi:hypothetical protein